MFIYYFFFSSVHLISHLYDGRRWQAAEESLVCLVLLASRSFLVKPCCWLYWYQIRNWKLRLSLENVGVKISCPVVLLNLTLKRTLLSTQCLRDTGVCFGLLRGRNLWLMSLSRGAVSTSQLSGIPQWMYSTPSVPMTPSGDAIRNGSSVDVSNRCTENRLKDVHGRGRSVGLVFLGSPLLRLLLQKNHILVSLPGLSPWFLALLYASFWQAYTQSLGLRVLIFPLSDVFSTLSDILSGLLLFPKQQHHTYKTICIVS